MVKYEAPWGLEALRACRHRHTQEYPQTVRHRPEKSLLLAKSPSNRGRTSDLGIAQCFLYSPTLFQLSYRRARSFERRTSEHGIAYFKVRKRVRCGCENYTSD